MDQQQNASPFHRGEQEVQSRLGVREQIEDLGQRMIRHYLPNQHREFYHQLPYLLLGSVDESGRPWASIVVGNEGFIQSPDDTTLTIQTPRIYGDPLNGNIEPGSPVGVLGIQFHTRRRNRLTAKVADMSNNRLVLDVQQAFGNCPQYIQSRDAELVGHGLSELGEERSSSTFTQLDQRAKDIIAKADNFYIATHYREDDQDRTQGADVSHRGGKPGFVRVEDDEHLVFPDYSGNNHYNTIGNIVMNPRAGLLFIDFDSGDCLYLTCTAEVIWDSEEKRAFTGAQRLVRFTVDQGFLLEKALPVRWTFLDYSPVLDRTGSWEEVDSIIAARQAENRARDYRVIDVQSECSVIKSFYLEPDDDKSIDCHKAGQFLPIEIVPPGADEVVRRTYTISNAPNGQYYRLSIKREPARTPEVPPGLSSNYFHDEISPGSVVRTFTPRGKFVLTENSTRPVVLVSAGVGITPMISMLQQLKNDKESCGCTRPVWFIHGAISGEEHAFGDWVRQYGSDWPRLSTHFVYSKPSETDNQGQHYDSTGRISVDLLKSILPLDDYDYYFCGPVPFMESMYQGLKGMNVSDDRINYEFFGPGNTLLKEEPGQSSGLVVADENAEPVAVKFAKSDISTTWDPSKGTLLDLAESEGLSPAYSCRSGICSTCQTRLVGGDVAYVDPPIAEPESGNALICCSYPVKSDEEFVLDL